MMTFGLQFQFYTYAVSHYPSDKKAEIDSLAAQYISTVRDLSSEQRVEILQKIQNAYTKCKEYSDDKVQLAMQTYEMVSLNRAVILQKTAYVYDISYLTF